jgi:hypothetical protein
MGEHWPSGKHRPVQLPTVESARQRAKLMDEDLYGEKLA